MKKKLTDILGQKYRFCWIAESGFLGKVSVVVVDPQFDMLDTRTRIECVLGLLGTEIKQRNLPEDTFDRISSLKVRSTAELM